MANVITLWPGAAPTSIQIPAATLQACLTGHAYWIRADGSLVDAGTNIAAANATLPPDVFDVSGGQITRLFSQQEYSWSLFYGAQTGNVGGKIGIAELWPTQPPESTTIPPYVRDVASHWLVTAGLGFVLQNSVPEAVSPLYDVTSQVNTALDSGPLLTSDFASLWGYMVAGAANQASMNEVADDGTVAFVATNTGALSAEIKWGPGSAINLQTAPLATASAASSVPNRIKLTAAAIAAQTTRIHLLGTRKTPIRRPKFIAPYIQWVNPGTGGVAPVVPTAASPMYLSLSAVR